MRFYNHFNCNQNRACQIHFCTHLREESFFVLDNNRSEHSFVRREHFQISKADESLKRGLIF